MTTDPENAAGDIKRRPEVEGLMEQLKELARGGGYAAPDELARFRRAVRVLLMIDVGPWRGYIGEKLSSAEGYADVLFSARRHQSYDSDAQSGAQRVRSIILADLAAAERNMFAPSPKIDRGGGENASAP